MRMLISIYSALLKEYGPQGWWPVTPEGKTKPIYSGGPKTDKQGLEVCLGAILTQNTSWKNVEKALVSLNKNNLIGVSEIQKIEIGKLEKIIRPAGFFRQKAERLKLLAKFLSGKKFSDITRGELLKIKGIGPETADSILLYACGKPEFVVDAYTKRIFNRVGLVETENYQYVKEFFGKNFPMDAKLYREFHALIVEHAKRFCRKKPDCGACPLNKVCGHFKGTQK